jgi:hypothetical protein
VIDLRGIWFEDQGAPYESRIAHHRKL